MTNEKLIILTIVIAVLIILIIIILIKFATPAAVPFTNLTGPAVAPQVLSNAAVTSAVIATPGPVVGGSNGGGPTIITSGPGVLQDPLGKQPDYTPTQRSFSRAYFAPYLARAEQPVAFLSFTSFSDPVTLNREPVTTYSYNHRSKKLAVDDSSTLLGKVQFLDSGHGYYTITNMKDEILKYNPHTMQVTFGADQGYIPLPLQILRRG
jgi:hypothetical protein